MLLAFPVQASPSEAKVIRNAYVTWQLARKPLLACTTSFSLVFPRHSLAEEDERG
jgi:hypothetical protein